MNIKKQKHINKKQKKQTLKAKNTETILDWNANLLQAENHHAPTFNCNPNLHIKACQKYQPQGKGKTPQAKNT
jgi:hypothetical protein